MWEGDPGSEVHVLLHPDLPPADVGVGDIHYVAFRVPDDEKHAYRQQRLTALDLRLTQVIVLLLPVALFPRVIRRAVRDRNRRSRLCHR
ncbi:MAG: hypothetical protein ACUVWS_13565 [Roseiflexus sp.]